MGSMDVDGLNDATQSDIVAAGLLFVVYFAIFSLAALAIAGYILFEQVGISLSVCVSPCFGYRPISKAWSLARKHSPGEETQFWLKSPNSG